MWSKGVKPDLTRAMGFAWKFNLVWSGLLLLSYVWPKTVAPLLGIFIIPVLWLTAPGQIAAQYWIALFYHRLHGGPPLLYFSVMTIFNFFFYTLVGFAFIRMAHFFRRSPAPDTGAE